MRSIILVLAFALAAVSALQLEEPVEQDASLQELAKQLGLELNLDFDLNLGFNLEDELPEEGIVDVDEFAILDRMLSLLIAESKALAKEIILLTERQLELEKLAEDVERRALDAGECAINVTSSSANMVASTTLDFVGCARDAAVTSINLVLDTKKAVLQLTLDGYQLYQLRRECKSYKATSIRKKTCKAMFTAKGVMYVANGQASLRHLIRLRKSVPAVATDATSCTTKSTENAIHGFDELNAAIDACAANFK
ncbi:GM13672 [Drosophila sechellia]|uniref:GM13672 n=1 Tax=Drosophila sechellia TaxID=7238 RepID=B4IJS4_DROSE|nr:GM13672 [Drosophila sechellia]